MDGYKATSHIKTSTQGKDTVIIALTASAFNKDRLKVLEHGGDAFISKPVREAEIFAMLAKHLEVKFIYDDEDAGHKPQAGQRISIEDMQSEAEDLPMT